MTAVPVILEGLSVVAIFASVTEASDGVRESESRESVVMTAVPVMADGAMPVDGALPATAVSSAFKRATTVADPPCGFTPSVDSMASMASLALACCVA